MMGDSTFGMTLFAGHGFWPLLIAVFIVVPVWRICQRAGFSGWLSLLTLVPLVNLGLLYFLAFAEWPIDKRTDPSN
ncbi:hypothetical protein ACFQGA_01730 [Marinobacter koreensis]|jgi:hypothetical protein|uniref:DUF805 domain-containing protein n=2 Tax=Marinobacter TaxID=2742 RepID=M7DAK1_9GAMM|nr:MULTISPECIES: hypothetical protein [Marinobacter]EMP54692.1 hypothetical protein MSNKSG1_15322 [Marinobacter santoriniensis NKSG1]MCK7548684.1 hypothetical protein [Marinobacter koreensis]MDX1817427.1 hypothetical protein [Marinobacter sp.]